MSENETRRSRHLGLKKSTGSRMPTGSTFYRRIVPGLVILLGVIMALVIVVAIAIFLGLIA